MTVVTPFIYVLRQCPPTLFLNPPSHINLAKHAYVHAWAQADGEGERESEGFAPAPPSTAHWLSGPSVTIR